MKRDYKLSCLSDSDMRQYEFIRNSRLPRGSFDEDPWWKPSQDAVVFWVVVVCGIAAIILSH